MYSLQYCQMLGSRHQARPAARRATWCACSRQETWWFLTISAWHWPFFKKYMFSLWMEELEVDWRQNWRNSWLRNTWQLTSYIDTNLNFKSSNYYLSWTAPGWELGLGYSRSRTSRDSACDEQKTCGAVKTSWALSNGVSTCYCCLFFKSCFSLWSFSQCWLHTLIKNSYGVFFVRCQLTTTRFTRAFARNRVQSWNDVPRFFPSQESSSIFFTKLSAQSRSGHFSDLFIPNHTDWGWWLIGLTGHPRACQNQAAWSENSSPQYRWSQKRLKNLFASLEIVQNSHGEENHSMFPPVIISFEVFLCDGLVVCHIPSAPGHAAAPCGGSVDGSPHWNALPCAVHARAHVHRSAIMDHEISWNIMKYHEMVDISGYPKKKIHDLKFHSTWNQLRSHKCIYTLYTYITYI